MEDLIKKYTGTDWEELCEVEKHLTEEFMHKYADKLNWYYLSWRQIMSEKFMHDHADKLNWEMASEYQFMSEQFIHDHADKVHWGRIWKRDLSEEFRRDHQQYMDQYNEAVAKAKEEEEAREAIRAKNPNHLPLEVLQDFTERVDWIAACKYVD